MADIFKTAFISAVLVVFTQISSAQIISANATVALAGPVSKEMSEEVQTKALQKFKFELLQWLADETGITVDTTSRVHNVGFSMFMDSCRSVARTESSFKGKKLSLTYNITAEDARNKLESFNNTVNSNETQAWNTLKEARTNNDFRAAHAAATRALFYSYIRLAPPPAEPQSGSGPADEARSALQELYDRIKVKSSGLILAGKTGLLIQEPPTITVFLDTLPLAGMMFTGRLQNGSPLFSAVTDENGRIVIDKVRIPFVPNGTLLDVGPDIASLVGAEEFIDPSDLRIKLNGNQVQSFIFKITPPIYTLDYKATSVSAITLPPEFANEAHVRSFLRDSCFLKERTSSDQVEMAITIKAQVSTYSYDETEETGVKLTALIIVDGKLLNPPKTNKKEMVFEKRYASHHTIPYGLYFWEANGKLRQAIKETIAGL